MVSAIHTVNQPTFFFFFFFFFFFYISKGEKIDSSIEIYNVKLRLAIFKFLLIHIHPISTLHQVMPRLLIGIDRPLEKSQIVNYVLEGFTREQQATVDVAITDGLSKLLRHLQENACIDSDLVAIFRKPNLSNTPLGAPHSHTN